MNDEGVGIAGWLLADLVLVLAIVFLALTPAALSDDLDIVEATPTPEPTVAPPVILDIGCEKDDQEDGSIAVLCEPELSGGNVHTYHWKAVGGGATNDAYAKDFSASFEGAGVVLLAVANAGGERIVAFPVRPLPVPTPEGLEVLTDFRFDQIILEGMTASVTWEKHIAESEIIRENLNKGLEDVIKNEWCPKPREPGCATTGTMVQDFLQDKYNGGLRIALVETFAHARGTGSVALARAVNDAFFNGIIDAPPKGMGLVNLFIACESARDEWFADYLDRKALVIGEVRINVFFVKPSSKSRCE